MKKIVVIYVMLFIAMIVSVCSCSKHDINEDSIYQISRISLSPQLPTQSDEVFIIDTICSYQILQSLSIHNYQIKYVRSFNSMMGMACFPVIDSLSLGKLVKGIYTLNFCLVDKSIYNKDSIVVSNTIYFEVH